jgi:hypothetical protein
MSTGPVQFKRIYNTVSSGSELQSSLTGNDVRMLEFDAANRHARTKVLAAGSNSLSSNEWLESAINTLLLDASACSDGATGYISLGSDMMANAQGFINFFDMDNTGDERLLRLAVANAGTAEVYLQNLSGTNNFVKVSATGHNDPTNQVLLFNPASTGLNQQFTYNGAGVERLVVLHADNVDAGSESVTFTVLPYSN